MEFKTKGVQVQYLTAGTSAVEPSVIHAGSSLQTSAHPSHSGYAGNIFNSLNPHAISYFVRIINMYPSPSLIPTSTDETKGNPSMIP